MLKKLFLLILTTLLLIIGWVYRDHLKEFYQRVTMYSFCEKPIKYRVGTVNPKFKMTEEDFSIYVKSAAALWNKEYDKELFVYDPDAKLTINLIFDERQSLTQEINEINTEIQTNKNLLFTKIKVYEQKYDELKQRIDELNKKIDYWNNNGGATKGEYEKLTTEQRDLQKEIDEINAEGAILNKDTSELNSKIKILNATISMFNSVLKNKPEAGVYIPTSANIEIYSYGNKTQLINTLAHEFGHALGLPHTDIPNSLMHPISTDETSLTDEDIHLLREFCSERNRFELIKNDLTNLVKTLIKKYKT